jgi:micrococcal nuclease
MIRALPFAISCSVLASLTVSAVVAVTAVLPGPVLPLLPRSGTTPVPAVEPPVIPRAVIPVEVMRVIDGDTVELKAHVWLDQTVVTRVRLRSIDAPELRAGCPEETRKAVAAQEALMALLHGGRAYLTGLGRDKYGGRVLGDLLTQDGHAISQKMLLSGHARAYVGGRRQGWC